MNNTTAKYDLWQNERSQATVLECGLKVLLGESKNIKYP